MGNAPFDFLTANEIYRDVFDAPLEEMADLSSQWPNPNCAQDPTWGNQSSSPTSPKPNPPSPPRSDPGQGKSDIPQETVTYNPTNSYYVSTSFNRSIGRVWASRMT